MVYFEWCSGAEVIEKQFKLMAHQGSPLMPVFIPREMSPLGTLSVASFLGKLWSVHRRDDPGENGSAIS
jgi:hypothetical protein